MRRLGVRARLTALYGAVFLVFGLALLATTYGLTDNAVRSQQLTVDIITADQLNPPEADPAAESAREAKSAQYEQMLKDGYRDQVLHTMIAQGGIALGALAVVGMLVGWFAASRGLRPLRKIAATARRVGVSRMGERVALTGPRDELRELADSFDAMLARLDAGFEAQRRFVANASHELRTPLAINRTLVEVAMARPDVPPELIELGRRLLDVNQRQEQTMGALLELARAERPLEGVQPLDLADIVTSVCRTLSAEADLRAVSIRVTAARVVTSGSAPLWERLVTNLVVNAIWHNHPGGTAWVSVGEVDGNARLEVSNTGPMLEPGEVDGLFEPFRRRRDRLAAPAGSGLGLSIVRAVAQAHSATIRASTRSGGGLIVIVTAAAISDSDIPAVPLDQSIGESG
jgi:signal transduction histidine kinase